MPKATVHAVLFGEPNTYSSFEVKGRTKQVLEEKVELKIGELTKKGWSIWLIEPSKD